MNRQRRKHVSSISEPASREAPAGAEVLVVGLNHRTAPLALIEQMSVGDADLPEALHGLIRCEHVTEALVLSTCMRTEIYAVTDCAHGALADVRDILGGWSGSEAKQLGDHLYSCYGEAAISHLFRVASGIDSAILGEGEIIRQVRTACEQAQKEGAAGPTLTRLFRHSLEVGKRARSETAISRGTTSLSRAAVSMTTDRLGSLAGRSILIVGAGEMGEGMAQALASVRGVAEIVVANRTWSKAASLAERIGGQPVELSGLAAALEKADLVLTSTGATSVLLEADDLRAGLPARAGRPLLVVDLAVPRDVDPRLGELPGVTLLNLDDLRTFVGIGMSERRREVGAVELIVADEVDRFLELTAQRSLAPVVAALRDRAEKLRRAELARYRVRMSGLDEEGRATVEALTRGLLAKLLHEPSVQLKTAAGSARGDQLAEAAHILFDL
jgi:glutamyl-tRNA reductase